MPMQTKFVLTKTNTDRNSVKARPIVYAKTFENLTEVKQSTILLAADDTLTVWVPSDTAENLVDPATYLFFQNNVEVDYEFTVDVDGTPNIYSIRSPANGFLLLSSGKSFNSTGDFAQSLLNIDKIRIDVPNSVDATVFMEIGS